MTQIGSLIGDLMVTLTSEELQGLQSGIYNSNSVMQNLRVQIQDLSGTVDNQQAVIANLEQRVAGLEDFLNR